MHEAANLVRRLKRDLGRSEPLLWTVEEHDDGYLHLHLATRMVMPKEWWERVWGRGFVHEGRKTAGDPVKMAGYLAKYVGKALAVGTGRHSYEVTQGFAPVSWETTVDSIDQAVWLMGAVLDHRDDEVMVLALHELDGWQGPRVWWLGINSRGDPGA